MKKSILFILVAAFIFTETFAQGLETKWRDLPHSPRSWRFDDLYFVSEKVGYAGGGSTVFKTSDGGENWEEIFRTSRYIRAIEFINEQEGFIGTLGDQFLLTKDGGKTWENKNRFPSARQSRICGMSHLGDILVAVGAWSNPAYFHKTEDKGETWRTVDLSEYLASAVDVWMVDEQSIFVSGRGLAPDLGAVIIHSIDGGETWKIVHRTEQRNSYLWKLQFVSPLVAYGSVEFGSPSVGAVKSVDGGKTWQNLAVSSEINDFQGIGFVDELHGWTGGWFSGMFETTDGGVTWSSSPFGQNINRVFPIRKDLVYASGARIYKYSTEEALPSPDPIPFIEKLPHEFSIVQSVASDLLLNIRLDRNTFVVIDSVRFDEQGRDFDYQVLKRERMDAGVYQLRFPIDLFEKNSNYRISVKTDERFIFQDFRP